MTITVAALFASPIAAAAVAQDLADAGFCRDDMSILGPGDPTALLAEVPGSYAEGLRRGGCVVTLRCGDGEDERACAVIERHRPAELSARGMTSARPHPPR